MFGRTEVKERNAYMPKVTQLVRIRVKVQTQDRLQIHLSPCCSHCHSHSKVLSAGVTPYKEKKKNHTQIFIAQRLKSSLRKTGYNLILVSKVFLF